MWPGTEAEVVRLSRALGRTSVRVQQQMDAGVPVQAWLRATTKLPTYEEQNNGGVRSGPAGHSRTFGCPVRADGHAPLCSGMTSRDENALGPAVPAQP
ncbi:hypothetical protein MRX96_043411 [Rhipicephalus microplus]